MKTYTAEIIGCNCRKDTTATFNSVTAARRWAEEFGTMADRCIIRNHHNRQVAEHRRDPSGDGTRWFKAHPVDVNGKT